MWLSAGAVLSSREHLAASAGIFGSHNWAWGEDAAGIEWAEARGAACAVSYKARESPAQQGTVHSSMSKGLRGAL